MSCPTGRNSSGLVGTCLDLSQLVGTFRNLSQLVATPVALRDLPWGPIYLKVFRPTACRLHPSGLQLVSVRPEGRSDGAADLARSTAEGVGGFHHMFEGFRGSNFIIFA